MTAIALNKSPPGLHSRDRKQYVLSEKPDSAYFVGFQARAPICQLYFLDFLRGVSGGPQGICQIFIGNANRYRKEKDFNHHQKSCLI